MTETKPAYDVVYRANSKTGELTPVQQLEHPILAAVPRVKHKFLVRETVVRERIVEAEDIEAAALEFEQEENDAKANGQPDESLVKRTLAVTDRGPA